MADTKKREEVVNFIAYSQEGSGVIVPKGNPGHITGLDASLDGKKLVICAATVPCGAAAKTIAQNANFTLKPVSEEQKVTDVRGKVTSGEADPERVSSFRRLLAARSVTDY